MRDKISPSNHDNDRLRIRGKIPDICVEPTGDGETGKSDRAVLSYTDQGYAVGLGSCFSRVGLTSIHGHAFPEIVEQLPQLSHSGSSDQSQIGSAQLN